MKYKGNFKSHPVRRPHRVRKNTQILVFYAVSLWYNCWYYVRGYPINTHFPLSLPETFFSPKLETAFIPA
jgi:hypothetical protein